MPTPTHFPVYLFDMDGTLMDSSADIVATLRAVFAAAEFPDHDIPDAFLISYIGRHLVDLFGDLQVAGASMDAMVEHYRSHYPSRRHAGTRVYPGIADMLASLGGRKSTATTKGTNGARQILEQFGLIHHFDHVQGTDGFPAKPEPNVILESLKVFGVRPEDCLLVGDAPVDIEAGRRAGVRTCAVRWGYGNHEEIARLEPDYWIDEPSQLLQLKR